MEDFSDKRHGIGCRGEEGPADAPLATDIVVSAWRNAEVRIGRDECPDVSWQIDLGHHDDGTIRGERNDFAQIVLRVVATMRGLIEDRCFVEVAELRTTSMGATPVQQGEPYALESPALIIGQVQLQTVQAQISHMFDYAKDAPLGQEMATHIEE